MARSSSTSGTSGPTASSSPPSSFGGTTWRRNPGAVRSLLEGHLEATQLANDDPEQAQSLVNQGIEAITGEAIPDEVISAAYGNLEFTVDPIASSLQESASDAEALGLLDPVELEGIYDLSLLNEVLAEGDREPVEGL